MSAAARTVKWVARMNHLVPARRSIHRRRACTSNVLWFPNTFFPEPACIPAPRGNGLCDRDPIGKDFPPRRDRKPTAHSAGYNPDSLALDLEGPRSSSALRKSINNHNVREREEHQ